MIIAKNIHKYYNTQDKLHAIKGVDIDINAGDFSIIKGPSGSGKSTLLNILSLIDNPSRGSISYFGEEINNDDEQVKRNLRLNHIGFIFQSFNLIPVMSLLENVILPLRAKGVALKKDDIQRAKDLINSVGLYDKLNNYPNQLSGGQQQRVAIARSLINNPKIVFADEPTANLDTKTAESIINLLLNRNSSDKVAFVFSTHDNRLLTYAKKTYTIQDGVII